MVFLVVFLRGFGRFVFWDWTKDGRGRPRAQRWTIVFWRLELKALRGGGAMWILNQVK